jgi:uncharacterized protein (TIGR03435 family)
LRIRTIAATVLSAAFAVIALGQVTTTAPAEAAAQDSTAAAAEPPLRFEIADVHTSPPRRYPGFQGALLENGRYILRDATMADLITTAYGLKNSSYINGGPSWLEWNRWDVIGKVPPGTTPAAAKQMLKNLLEERFKLETHQGETQVPAYWLIVAPGGLKLKATPAGTGDGACHGSPVKTGSEPGAVPLTTLSCTDKSVSALAETLTNNGGGMYLQHPVVDKTGLKGAYDFDLKYTPIYMLAHADGAGVTIFDALQNQLGLKLELKTAPQQGLVVDSVAETPAPNPPNLAKLLPPQPAPQFEVAVIKPAAPGDRGYGRISGDEVNVHNFPLKFLIVIAWDLDPNDSAELVGAPKWLDSDKIDVQAKVATENLGQGAGPGRPQISPDDLRTMLKALLIDRFEMKVHMEDRPVDAYDLVAAKPKLTPADPRSRTNCHIGPGPDGNDPRITHPILNMLLTCTNVTMAQAAEELPHFAAYYLYYPPDDKTGLKGGWDFTLNWSSGDNMPGFNPGGGSPQSQNPEKASEPNGALSFYDAVSKELGLKLVKTKRPEPVLVIDHMDEQPTPN